MVRSRGAGRSRVSRSSDPWGGDILLSNARVLVFGYGKRKNKKNQKFCNHSNSTVVTPNTYRIYLKTSKPHSPTHHPMKPNTDKPVCGHAAEHRNSGTRSQASVAKSGKRKSSLASALRTYDELFFGGSKSGLDAFLEELERSASKNGYLLHEAQNVLHEHLYLKLPDAKKDSRRTHARKMPLKEFVKYCATILRNARRREHKRAQRYVQLTPAVESGLAAPEGSDDREIFEALRDGLRRACHDECLQVRAVARVLERACDANRMVSQREVATELKFSQSKASRLYNSIKRKHGPMRA